MEMLESIKQTLISQAQAQMAHLECVDAEELGEVIDMIKDLEEACYYHTITEAMHQEYPSEYSRMYYDGSRKPREGNYHDSYRPSDWMSSDGRYTDRARSHDWRDDGEEMHDRREGRSPKQRKMYMETKEMHPDKTRQLQELEKYMKELTDDMVEMISDASSEEKQYLGNRLSALSSKIAKLD